MTELIDQGDLTIILLEDPTQNPNDPPVDYIISLEGPPGPQGPAGMSASNAGQPRFTGEGPPGVIIGAAPGDEYLDNLTGNIYRLT